MGKDQNSADHGASHKDPPCPPTQESVDAFFRAAHRARMFVGAKEHGELTGLKFAGELTREDLLFLHAALRIPKEHEPYRCHCFGDVTIELIGDSGRVAILALHYHRKPLLSHSGWSYDAELGSRSALLAFLSNFKVLSGLKEWEKELQESEAEQKRQGVRMWINSGGIPLGDAMMRASKEQPG